MGLFQMDDKSTIKVLDFGQRWKMNDKKPDWAEKKYSFFCHKECEFFPCHSLENVEDFNCLFCYCPLYALGEKCGGNFRYTEKGIKDCTNCTFPHRRGNYGKIVARYGEIMELARKK